MNIEKNPELKKELKLINTKIRFSNSYSEIQTFLREYFQTNAIFTFRANILDFIIEKKYFDIFSFLFNEGFIYQFENEGVFNAFSKKVPSDSKHLITNDTLEFVKDPYLSSKIIPEFVDETNFNSLSYLSKKCFIADVLTNIKKIDDFFQRFLIREIQKDKQLILFINLFLTQTKRQLNYYFIKLLINNSILEDMSVESQLTYFDNESLCTSILKKYINNPESYDSIFNGFKNLVSEKKNISTYYLSFILENAPTDFVLKFNRILFDRKHKLVNITSSYYYTDEDEYPYDVEDYSLLEEYLDVLLNNDFNEDLISKRFFIFNTEFSHKDISRDLVYELFHKNIHIIKEKHYQKFSNKIEHLREEFKVFFLMENF